MVNCWFGLVVWDSAGAPSVSLSNNLSFTGWSHKSKPPSQTNNWPLVSWSFVTALICHDNLQMKMFGYHIWLTPLKELELKRIPWTAARNRVFFTFHGWNKPLLRPVISISGLVANVLEFQRTGRESQHQKSEKSKNLKQNSLGV